MDVTTVTSFDIADLPVPVKTVRDMVNAMSSKARKWVALQSVKLPPFKVGKRTVDRLYSFAPHLQRIDMSCVEKHSDEVLPFSSEMLREIVFPRRSKMTDAGLCATLNACPSLVSIEMQECNYITDVSMEHALMACVHLKRMKLIRCAWVTGRTLQYLSASKFTGNLNKLANNIGNKAEQLESTARGAAKGGSGGVTAARTVKAAMTDVFELHQGQQPQLEWLDISQCSAICDSSLQRLDGFPEMRALFLQGCTVLTHQSAVSISLNVRELQILDMSWCSITDESVRLIFGACHGLQFMGLAHCPLITNEVVRIMTPKSTLKLCGGTGQHYVELAQLSLRSCPQIDSSALWWILTWQKLRGMDLGGLGMKADLLEEVQAQGWQEVRCQRFVRKLPCPPISGGVQKRLSAEVGAEAGSAPDPPSSPGSALESAELALAQDFMS